MLPTRAQEAIAKFRSVLLIGKIKAKKTACSWFEIEVKRVKVSSLPKSGTVCYFVATTPDIASQFSDLNKKHSNNSLASHNAMLLKQVISEEMVSSSTAFGHPPTEAAQAEWSDAQTCRPAVVTLEAMIGCCVVFIKYANVLLILRERSVEHNSRCGNLGLTVNCKIHAQRCPLLLTN